MTKDEQLTLEFAYTSLDDSCRDEYSPHVFCRRNRRHPADFHAAGYGPGRVKWTVALPDTADIVWQ